MRQSFAPIAVAVCIALPVGSAFGADPQLLNLVMPDAQVMAGMNVTNAEISPLGTFLLAKVSGEQGFQQFISQTGFDPRKDVTEVMAASNGNTTSPSALMLAKGNFDVAKIMSQIGQSKTQQVSTYDGATLITSTDTKDTHAAAFIGGAIAIAGDVASVKAALDRNSGVNSINPALATQVHTLSTTQDAWSVSMASLASLMPGAVATAPADGMASQAMQFVRNIQSSSAGVKFGATVLLTAQATADTAQDASALADVIKMVASLAAMSSAGTPGAAAVTQMMQSLQVSVSGAVVNLTASVPEAQIETLLSTANAPKSAAMKSRKM